jgi:hypothetical protein
MSRQLDLPTVRYLSVAVPGSDQEAHVVVFLPSAAAGGNGPSASSKKFPLLVDVYGGPGFQVSIEYCQGRKNRCRLSGVLANEYSCTQEPK